MGTRHFESSSVDFHQNVFIWKWPIFFKQRGGLEDDTYFSLYHCLINTVNNTFLRTFLHSTKLVREVAHHMLLWSGEAAFVSPSRHTHLFVCTLILVTWVITGCDTCGVLCKFAAEAFGFHNEKVLYSKLQISRPSQQKQSCRILQDSVGLTLRPVRVCRVFLGFWGFFRGNSMFL